MKLQLKSLVTERNLNIVADKESGMKIKDMVKKYQISQPYIRQIVRGITMKEWVRERIAKSKPEKKITVPSEIEVNKSRPYFERDSILLDYYNSLNKYESRSVYHVEEKITHTTRMKI